MTMNVLVRGLFILNRTHIWPIEQSHRVPGKDQHSFSMVYWSTIRSIMEYEEIATRKYEQKMYTSVLTVKFQWKDVTSQMERLHDLKAVKCHVS